MVIGNSMTVCSLVMGRLRDEVNARRAEIEASLALGATSRQAAMPHLRRALENGMTPIVDNTKTVGIIQLPGAMTGMILAGASPLEAVQLQLIVMYMLIGAAAFTGLAATFLIYRQFFTSRHQLVLPFKVLD
ncbi:ABC transporter permease [Chloroflexi bacterium TSY]|nr:ABC transporter permease [Chloroflexi bacterium TSY]